MMLLNLGLNGISSLSNADFTTFAGDAVNQGLPRQAAYSFDVVLLYNTLLMWLKIGAIKSKMVLL
jgi:hypothetical protein